MVEITNSGARLLQNRFGWRWLLFEELWIPSLGDQIKKLKHIPDLKCIPNLERILDNKNALTILTVLFKQFPFCSIPYFY